MDLNFFEIILGFRPYIGVVFACFEYLSRSTILSWFVGLETLYNEAFTHGWAGDFAQVTVKLSSLDKRKESWKGACEFTTQV